MTRKRRIIFAAAGALLCSLFLFFLGSMLQERDKEEFLRECKKYEGIWQSADGKFALEMYHVTSGNIVFSLNNKKTNKEISLINANSIGDGYEFSYKSVRLAGPVYYVYAGNESTGRIYLNENKIRVEIPEIPGKPRVLEFQGTLTKKSELSREKPVHLIEYMDTKKTLPQSLRKYCSLLYDDEGKVWRIRVLFAENSDYRKTDMDGILLGTSEEECGRKLGEAIESCDLARDGGTKKIYEKGEYRYTIVRNQFGVIKEVDCQKKELPGTVREGEFLMKGDTLFRYAGDFHIDSGEAKIVLPEKVRRIAAHAFDMGENGCSIVNTANYMRELVLPAGIYVEEDAFKDCGPIQIRLEEGWKVIPRRAFAHTVSLQSKLKKKDWVIFVLPTTVERIEEEAFALDNSTKGLRTYWRELEESDTTTVPVRVLADYGLSNINYIGDNALWGIKLSSLPAKATFLGKNITLENRTTVNIPEGITVLREDNFYFTNWGANILKIGRNVQDIGVNAFRDSVGSVSFNNVYIEKGNRYMYVDKYGLLRSKNGKILYGVASRFLLENLITGSRHNEITIPEGVEEIRSSLLIDTVSVIRFPKSLKKISNASLSNGERTLWFPGNVPVITGERDEIYQNWLDTLISYNRAPILKVRRDDITDWIASVTEGVSISEEQKSELKRKLKKNVITG